MAIKDQPQPPRFRQISNILLLLSSLFLLANIFLPNLLGGNSASALQLVRPSSTRTRCSPSFGRPNEIRYQLKGESDKPGQVPLLRRFLTWNCLNFYKKKALKFRQLHR